MWGEEGAGATRLAACRDGLRRACRSRPLLTPVSRKYLALISN